MIANLRKIFGISLKNGRNDAKRLNDRVIAVPYDVNITFPQGSKRLRNVSRECINHGKRVQNSVFECILTEAQFVSLKNRLNGIIDSGQDSIRFYVLGKDWKRKVEILGKDMGIDLHCTYIL